MRRGFLRDGRERPAPASASAAGSESSCERRRQPPLALGILRPDDLGLISETSLITSRRAKSERRRIRSRAEKYPPGRKSPGARPRLACGMRDAGQLQPAPRRHTDAPDVQGGPEPLAQFLLNPRLCALRLHIQIHSQERRRENRKNAAAQAGCEAARLFSRREGYAQFEEKIKAHPDRAPAAAIAVILNPAARGERARRLRARIEAVR